VRYPRQLSGGQQQRVALARAIVIRPSVLLLDEPLSNLDAKLREEMRGEIRQLQQQLGVTTLFVTHDQEEALTISDRVVVLDQGRIQQIGSPREIYLDPRTLFVARFIGEGNFFEGTVGPRTPAGIRFAARDGATLILADAAGVREGEPATVAVRAQALRLLGEDDPAVAEFGNRLPGTVDAVSYLGGSTSYRVRLGPERTVRVVRQNDESEGTRRDAWAPGARVVVAWRPASGRLLPRA